MTSTKERLIDAAFPLFYENGFNAVGLDRVIDEVGVTKTTFYKHFESKDDLIIAVLEKRDTEEMADLLKQMRERAKGNPRAALLAMFDILEEWFGQADFRGCLFMNAAVEYPDPNDPIHRAALRHNENLEKELLEFARAGQCREPQVLTELLMLLVTGAITSRHLAQDSCAGKKARAAAEVLVGRYMPGG